MFCSSFGTLTVERSCKTADSHMMYSRLPEDDESDLDNDTTLSGKYEPGL